MVGRLALPAVLMQGSSCWMGGLGRLLGTGMLTALSTAPAIAGIATSRRYWSDIGLLVKQSSRSQRYLAAVSRFQMAASTALATPSCSLLAAMEDEEVLVRELGLGKVEAHSSMSDANLRSLASTPSRAARWSSALNASGSCQM